MVCLSNVPGCLFLKICLWDRERICKTKGNTDTRGRSAAGWSSGMPLKVRNLGQWSSAPVQWYSDTNICMEVWQHSHPDQLLSSCTCRDFPSKWGRLMFYSQNKQSIAPMIFDIWFKCLNCVIPSDVLFTNQQLLTTIIEQGQQINRNKYTNYKTNWMQWTTRDMQWEKKFMMRYILWGQESLWKTLVLELFLWQWHF